MQATLKWMLALVCAATFCGCRNKAKEQRREDLRALMHGTTGDAQIEAAMVKARESLPEFIRALQSPAPNQRQFMIRAIFPAKDAKQQILWVTNVSYDGKQFHGKVDDNTSRPGSGIAKDGSVTVPPERIADWMYNEDGQAVGGHMLRVLKSRMTPEEWAPFERQFSFKE